MQDSDVWARVDRFGWCEAGWAVDGGDMLTDEDLLLIGVAYHTIINRRR